MGSRTRYRRLLGRARRRYRSRGAGPTLRSVPRYLARRYLPSVWNWIYCELYTRDVEQRPVPIDPYERRWVDPTDIVHFTGRADSPWDSFVTDLGSIQSGRWDQPAQIDEVWEIPARFNDHPRYQSIEMHFNDGVPWAETPYYQTLIERIRGGKIADRGATSEADVRQRFDAIDTLYEQIKSRGYQSQPELAAETGHELPKIEALRNEIIVDFGRDGQPLFVDGRHRLSVAKVLEIESVPVAVAVRHTEWVERLEADHHGDSTLTHHHPDRTW